MKSLTSAEKTEIYWLVKKKVDFFSYLASSLNKHDLAHEIYIKMIPYTEKNFDPSRSSLETFIEFKTKKMLIDFSDTFHYGSTYNKNKIKSIENAKQELKKEKAPITWQAIRKRAGLSKKQTDSVFYPLYFTPDYTANPIEDLITSHPPSKLDALIKDEDSLHLYSTMKRVLSDYQYSVLVKKYIEDKDYPSIADELNLPVSKIHSLSISAKRKLKKALTSC